MVDDDKLIQALKLYGFTDDEADRALRFWNEGDQANFTDLSAAVIVRQNLGQIRAVGQMIDEMLEADARGEKPVHH